MSTDSKVLAQAGLRAVGEYRFRARSERLIIAGGPILDITSVYAFVIAGRCQYVGVGKLVHRLNRYRAKGRNRVRGAILAALAAGQRVTIMAIPEPPMVAHAGRRINIAHSIELDLIARLRPPANVMGIADPPPDIVAARSAAAKLAHVNRPRRQLAGQLEFPQ